MFISVLKILKNFKGWFKALVGKVKVDTNILKVTVTETSSCNTHVV